MNPQKKRKTKNSTGSIISFEPDCPLCKSGSARKLYENHVSLFKCRRCGIIFNSTFRELKYDDSYFTDQYREQYGKTYIEDFEGIYNSSMRRLKKILKIRKDTGNLSGISVLDIGSAMGFFLKAALDSGIKKLAGIEISSFAAGFCREKYGIKVINSPFSEAKLTGKYDIITAWYFLEHCRDPLTVVTAIYDHLNEGGIFALATPSFFGPQYVFKRFDWMKMHPADHRIDFSPKTSVKFLKKSGFRKIITFPGGIHPERMIPVNSFLFKPFNEIYTGISRLLSFSDTIEIYAVK